MKVENIKLLIEHGIMRSNFRMFIGYHRKIREKTKYDLKVDFTGLETAQKEFDQFLNISEGLIIAEGMSKDAGKETL